MAAPPPCETCFVQPAMPGSAYCGKTCEDKDKCELCHKRPKYKGGKQPSSYCSKTCADNAKALRSPTPAKSPSLKSNQSSKSSGPACAIVTCKRTAHENADGTYGRYCSVSHKKLGEAICLYCRKGERRANSAFCSRTCRDEAANKGPILMEIPSDHAIFASVADQFTGSWRHPTKCPGVKRIYKIMPDQATCEQYNKYRADVETRGNFAARGMTAGNEQRRWHGTKRKCTLGDMGQAKLCGDTTCCLCNIIKTSFDLTAFGKNTGWGRFGRGIYTSSTSSKSNDYSKNIDASALSPLKAVLLNRVVVGRGDKTYFNHSTWTSAPPGFDSVLAEPFTIPLAGALNYDEVVVYRNEAIRPAYLVLYKA
ncbi:ADP-ribosylation [Schizophyllum commune H4-8]|uniref:ADP-ribosylation n=1 Tax=Schizophyllum commune (strain H4-8 / FGSC 9210) TaxID=578458 RepID=UPI00215FEFAC|nr:ADP-ribosylation [Schizophyllum commune H4-8]KAI5885938.1 ADP-ribosylation [Schizophyllum commune H4-8]